MKKIKLDISGITSSQNQNGAYALILVENQGNRRLPIIIGGFEAQSIAIHLENMSPARPLTHDLFKLFAEAFNITVTEVLIYNLNQGVFYSKLICKAEGSKEIIEVDARTSDAIAIALRFDCPIYTHEFILNSAGILIEEDQLVENALDKIEEEVSSSASGTEEFSRLSQEELKEMLRLAIEDEAYERAGKIRDELAKRK